ncbi:hypothetical protein [Streptomyces sp. BPTC-684]|uniref:hypothetical protein n=1 Tax=Streptomyces sp. BPTC-684 TaxID=3043734 RepID=UPI0024B24A7F|nr:hypothetical protein [Streptomyces sp. BPTC-684]WHM37378.1 hypothetical protein QIY60_10990 [Streptomyces sp. BPTC-684]
MPRGRHRHSPPLHRLLSPSAVAGAAVFCAGGAWLFDQPLALRSLAAAAAVAAVTGSVLMRGWDRAAGRRVAELTRSRAADQWRTEERIAELEADLEESRELRGRLDAKLRAKRMELAGLRGEHAALLRRYATAETERATALEGRRQLALEANAPKALPAAASTPTPAAYAAASKALENLPYVRRAQEARSAAAEAAKAPAPKGVRPSPAPASPADREADEPQGKRSAAAGSGEHVRPSSAALPALPAAPKPVAAAVVPYVARPAVRPEGSFDFFGTAAEKKAVEAAIEAAAEEDLADVVGEEVLAERPHTGPERVVGKVIDLTAHDETEQLDVAVLRTAIS